MNVEMIVEDIPIHTYGTWGFVREICQENSKFSRSDKTKNLCFLNEI